MRRLENHQLSAIGYRLSAISYRLSAIGCFALALALYVRTGAPGLLTGDQAEHQMVAVTLGVPHATGYPLFSLLNGLAVRLLPWLDPARAVTLTTALWSSLAVALAFLVARRLSGSLLAGALAAGLLAVAPIFWSLAVIAEVYTLQALFILLIWWLLLIWWGEHPSPPGPLSHKRGGGEATSADAAYAARTQHQQDIIAPFPARGGGRGEGCVAGRRPRALYGAACVAGLAVTHHGSFVPIVVPALLLAGAPLLRAALAPGGGAMRRVVLGCLGWGLLGLTPWLYLAAQFALFRPFDYYRGQGLPYHYYWGNPASWGDVVNLALGGGFRGKIFTHGWEHLPELGLAFVRSLQAEFWWGGLALGILGPAVLARRHWRAALLSGMIFGSAALFGINVAADVPKAPVYYLPAYVVFSVWAGVGAGGLAAGAHRLGGRRLAVGLLGVALLMPPVLAGQRFERLDRSADIGPRQFAHGVLELVEPYAVILCRWEHCMALRYLQLAEGRRLDVQLDQTEPEGGANWAERAGLYYPQHPLYAVRFDPQLAERYPLYPISERYDLWQIRPPQ